MIIFGTASSHRNGGRLNTPCEVCGVHDVVSFRRFVYFHLFWIPVFPLWFASGAECQRCGSDRTVSEQGASALKDAAREARRPLWHWVGAVLLLAAAGPMIMLDDEREMQAQAAATSPSPGDLWVVDARHTSGPGLEYPYTTLQVTAVEGDKVLVSFSQWQYESFLGAYAAIRKAVEESDPSYFDEAGSWVERAAFAQMQKDRDLIWVKPPERPAASDGMLAANGA